MNHPISAEHRVRERQAELLALAQTAHTRAAHRTHPLRRALGRTLVTLGVIVGLPRERRRPAVEGAVALLDGARLPC